MRPLYFCITEEPDPAVFDAGWVEIVDGRLVLDRTVWRGEQVSRSPESCVVLRSDPDYDAWALTNMADGRVVVLTDEHRRYDVLTGMSVTLRSGTWKGTLTGAFTFVVTSVRPHAPVRRHGVAGPSTDPSDEPTSRGWPVRPAVEYLDRHRIKRLALAHMWRRHLVHTPGLSEDLTSATVGRAFGVSASTVTGWREDLAAHVFGERGHQSSIRDLVVKYGVMTRSDVAEVDRYLGESRQATTLPGDWR